MGRALVLLLVLASLGVAPAAHAQGLRPPDQQGFQPGPVVGGGTTALPPALATAVDALARDPIYVAPDAIEALPQAQVDELRERIDRANAGPVYLAVLSREQVAAAGGDELAALRAIGRAGALAGREGVYGVVGDSSFRAGKIGATPFADGTIPRIATDAVELRGSEGAGAVLREFVQRVGQAAANGGEIPGQGPGVGGFGGLGLLALAGIGGGAFVLARRRRRRREEEAEAAELRDTARDDLVALGEDVRALDLDVQMPGADRQAVQDYGAAVQRYEQAERLLDRARRPDEFAAIGQALEEGRFAMASAKARLEGRPVPERRPPCFFDPRHGPSTRDVPWSPDGYEPRPVPVCEADAVRLESGQAPMTREIVAGGRRVPLYDAPAYYSPYAGGFFGGFSGFLPGLLFGSVLSSALTPGAFIGGDFAGYGDGFGGFGDGGDLAGGGFDLGDFAGAGDFGGGDFGGGDFGGGDF